MKYSIDEDILDEGGSAEFYSIKNRKNMGFKQFRNKQDALFAFKTQKLLNKFGLAPKIYGKVCRLSFKYKKTSIKTNWGFITQKVSVPHNTYKYPSCVKMMKKIQELVEDIKKNTGLDFWDCHEYNVGYTKTKRLVCIDTGAESFKEDSNAWGHENPGPKCEYCKDYGFITQCKCGDY